VIAGAEHLHFAWTSTSNRGDTSGTCIAPHDRMKLSIVLVSLLAVASAACARNQATPSSRSSSAELRDAEHVVVSVHKDPATRSL